MTDLNGSRSRVIVSGQSAHMYLFSVTEDVSVILMTVAQAHTHTHTYIYTHTHTQASTDSDLETWPEKLPV